MAVVSMKQLLEAGVHFGHQTRRWNPKMAPYIYTERNGIYIIDLQKTVKKLEEAYNFVRELAANGQSILFVGTKKQAQDAIKEEAERVGQYYVNARWLGGMLTNFRTMRTRIDRLAQLKKMEADGTFAMLPKKEVIKHQGEIAKLEKYLGGVKEMKKLPGALFIVDPRKERNAIAEARKLHIPIVAIVDTNCDPDEVDYVIPGNDDAIRAIRLIASTMANAVTEGRQGEENEQGSCFRFHGSECFFDSCADGLVSVPEATGPDRRAFLHRKRRGVAGRCGGRGRSVEGVMNLSAGVIEFQLHHTRIGRFTVEVENDVVISRAVSDVFGVEALQTFL